MEDLNKAEAYVVNTAREPARELLGAEADSVFQQLDDLKSALLIQAADSFQGSAGRGRRGLAQVFAKAFAFATLLDTVKDASKYPEGEPRTSRPTFNSEGMKGDTELTVTRSGSQIVADVEVRVTLEAGSIAIHESSKGRLEVNVCPDASGDVKMTLSFHGSTDASGKGSTVRGTYDDFGTITAHVDDNADFVGFETQINVSRTEEVDPGQTGTQARKDFLEAAFGRSWGIRGGEVSKRSDARVESKSNLGQEAQSKSLQASESIVSAAAYGVVNQAQDLWQNGYCVEIVTEGAGDSNEVQPGSDTAFTARVRHKFEGGDLDVPIEATLSGKESLEPGGKSGAPVHYTYKAPEESTTSATVALETRSRRGVAKRTLVFRTGTPNYRPVLPTQSGLVCSLDRPFSITESGTVQGWYDFVPSSAGSGQVTVRQTITFEGHRCESTASGTYSIVHYTSQAEPQVDIIMDVTVSEVCDGVSGPSVDTQYRILLEPTSDPSCQ